MIVTESQLESLREQHRGETIVFVHGTYDLFHVGHLACLEWSKDQGDLLVVGVCNDERTRIRKGPSRPIVDQAARMVIVDSLKVVDYTVLTDGQYNGRVPASLVTAQMLQPDVVVLSTDCSLEEEVTWKEHLDETGTQVVRHPEELRITSTSEIVQRILEA